MLPLMLSLLTIWMSPEFSEIPNSSNTLGKTAASVCPSTATTTAGSIRQSEVEDRLGPLSMIVPKAIPHWVVPTWCEGWPFFSLTHVDEVVDVGEQQFGCEAKLVREQCIEPQRGPFRRSTDTNNSGPLAHRIEPVRCLEELVSVVP